MRTLMFTALLTMAFAVPAQAGIGSKAAGKLAEFLLKKFGKEAAGEGAEKLTAHIMKAAARHGDDVVRAVRKVGPKALTLVDDAGANAPSVLRLINHYGDDVVTGPEPTEGAGTGRPLRRRRGEGVDQAQGIAEPLIENLGSTRRQGGQCPRAASGAAARHDGRGDLAAIGRTPELLEVIARHGDKAMDFIWKNKAVLAGSTPWRPSWVTRNRSLTGRRPSRKTSSSQPLRRLPGL